MTSTVTRFAVASLAVIAIGCGGTDHGDGDVNPPATMTPGEAVGTSGTNGQLITVSGCVGKSAPDGFFLTGELRGLGEEGRIGGLGMLSLSRVAAPGRAFLRT